MEKVTKPYLNLSLKDFLDLYSHYTVEKIIVKYTGDHIDQLPENGEGLSFSCFHLTPLTVEDTLRRGYSNREPGWILRQLLTDFSCGGTNPLVFLDKKVASQVQTSPFECIRLGFQNGRSIQYRGLKAGSLFATDLEEYLYGMTYEGISLYLEAEKANLSQYYFWSEGKGEEVPHCLGLIPGETGEIAIVDTYGTTSNSFAGHPTKELCPKWVMLVKPLIAYLDPNLDTTYNSWTDRIFLPNGHTLIAKGERSRHLLFAAFALAKLALDKEKTNSKQRVIQLAAGGGNK